MDLSLIIPAYNEERNIPAFFAAARDALTQLDRQCELIFVDDGSSDGTLAAMRGVADQATSQLAVQVVSFSRNFGKEAAMFAGLKRAEGDLVGIIDSDLQQRPETVVEMVRVLDEHSEYDCVAACQNDRRSGALLNGFSRIYYKLLGAISEMDVIPNASDFRVFRRNVADALLSVDEYYRFSKGLFSWIGFNTYALEYTAEERREGTSRWSFRKLFKYGVNGLLSFTTLPLRLATYLGLFASAAAGIYLIVVLVQRLAWGVDVPGYATIVALILLIGGIQLLVLGIIGEYLARTYIQGKRRPIYIEREHFRRG